MILIMKWKWRLTKKRNYERFKNFKDASKHVQHFDLPMQTPPYLIKTTNSIEGTLTEALM
jgi:hypothetical protein